MQRKAASRWSAALVALVGVTLAAPPARALDPATVGIVYFTGDRFDSDDKDQPFVPQANASLYGDACTARLDAELRQRGYQVFVVHPGIQEGVIVRDVRAKRLRAVRLDIEIGAHPPFGMFRNAQHYAAFMGSAPYRKLQQANLALGLDGVAYAYVRAALVLAEKDPVVRPDDLKERPLGDIGGATAADFDRAFRGKVYPVDRNARLLSKMKGLFNFDEKDDDDKTPDPPAEPEPPSDDLILATAHGLLADKDNEDLAHARYVSLTMSNVLVARLSLRAYDRPIPDDLRADLQDALDRVAAECSRSNYGAELDELKKLGASGRKLLPVDLDAFQRRAGEILRRTASPADQAWFDAIQAVK